MSFSVSLNPTYLCNFRCTFCYLTPAQLGDKTTTLLSTISSRLNEISRYKIITHIDLYGGEVSLLPTDYLNQLKMIIREYYQGPISVITNFNKIIDFFQHNDIDVSVSWDYKCRERWDVVLRNIVQFSKPVHVLMLASKCMVHWHDDDIKIANYILSTVRNIKSVEIKPYSTNQANQDYVSFTNYETFIHRWMTLTSDHEYEFVNETQIKQSLNKQRNAWSDDHVYITPSGKFAVLEFDENDNEFFLELDDFKQYQQWAKLEKVRVRNNKFCGQCHYLGHCLSEHLRNVKSLNNSCNGFRYLLDGYAKKL